jgi:hypothetical protein
VGASGFTVNEVAFAELPNDEEGIIVGLTEDLQRNENLLILSRAFAHTDQDRELGQDTYCLSVSSGATVYGGVKDCRIMGGVLTLQLSPKAAEALGVPEHCRFLLNVDPDTVSRLADGFRKVFAVDRDVPQLHLPQ